MIASFDTLIVGALLLVAAFMDLRTREVPGWLTFGGIASGVVVAALNGSDAVLVSLLGTTIGGLIILPFVLIGAFGAADALLLAAIGAWKGPPFVLWTVWWTSLAGATLATLAWRRGRMTFPYVPAIAVGASVAALTG
jgi:Flp pilus assembly protein protease CpaA